MFDLAALRFVRSATGDSLSALAGTGELLAVIDVAPGTAEREAALAALDAALDRARVPRESVLLPGQRVRTRVALYNPYSAEVAVGSLPDTVAYGDGRPLELPATGALGVLDGEVLTVGARALARREPTPASLSRAYLAHRDA